MITVTRHDATTLALRSDYAHKDAIKALAPYPAVRWDKESKAWLLDARMWEALVYHLGAELAPLSVELLFSLPLGGVGKKPGRSRRTNFT